MMPGGGRPADPGDAVIEILDAVAPSPLDRYRVDLVAVPFRTPVPTASGTWHGAPALLWLAPRRRGSCADAPTGGSASARRSSIPRAAVAGPRAGTGARRDRGGPRDGRGLALASALEAGIETALLDLASRRAGMPVAALLAGASGRGVARLAVPVSALVSADDPAGAAAEAAAAVATADSDAQAQGRRGARDARTSSRAHRGRARGGRGGGRASASTRTARGRSPTATEDAPRGGRAVPDRVRRAAAVRRSTRRRRPSSAGASASRSRRTRRSPGRRRRGGSSTRVRSTCSSSSRRASAVRSASLASPRSGPAGVPVVLSTFFETGIGLAAALRVLPAVARRARTLAHGLATAGLLEHDLLACPARRSTAGARVPDAAAGRGRRGLGRSPARRPSAACGGFAGRRRVEAADMSAIRSAPRSTRIRRVTSAARDPDGLALVDGDVRLTWPELPGPPTRRRPIGGAAVRRPGDRVAVLAAPSARPLVGLVARRSPARGGCVVPLGPRARRASEVAEARTQARRRSSMTSRRRRSPRRRARRVRRSISPASRRRRDRRRPTGAAGARARSPPPSTPSIATPPSRVLTSGTTGRPKVALLLASAALLASADAWTAALAAGDRLAALPSASPTSPASGVAWRALGAGVPLAIAPASMPGGPRRASPRRRAEPPLARADPARRVSSTRARRAAAAGDAARRAPRRRPRSPPALVLPAAAAGLAGRADLRADRGRRRASPPCRPREAAAASGSAGRAAPRRRAPDRRRRAPDGVGEIEVRTPAAFSGYLGDAERRGGASRPTDGCGPGDVGPPRRATAASSVVDRREDLLVSGGENVYPAEVEAVLEPTPRSPRPACVGRADERGAPCRSSRWSSLRAGGPIPATRPCAPSAASAARPVQGARPRSCASTRCRGPRPASSAAAARAPADALARTARR